MRISLIVAHSENRVIGREGELPWRLSNDLRHFKRLTMGHAILMGRKTMDSIGRCLPGRHTVVLTRDPHYSFDSAAIAHTWDEALGQAIAWEEQRLHPAPETASESTGIDPIDTSAHPPIRPPSPGAEVFVVGGAEIYTLALPHAQRIYLTKVHTAIDGDTYFPATDPAEWHVHDATSFPADEKNAFAHSLIVLDRVA